MEEPLIWTRDDIVRFTHDADDYNRNWAWCWLRRHHTDEASRQAARAIADADGGVVCSGIEAYARAPTTEGAEAIAALKLRSDLPKSVRQRLEYLEHPERENRIDDPLNDEVERLSREPKELKRKASPMLRSRDTEKRLIALGAIGNQQHQWATDILLHDFAWLLTSGDPVIVWDTLDSLRDPRSLPAILAAWVPGERVIADLYARIHHLSGSATPLPAGIARDAEAERQRSEAARALRAVNREAAKRGVRRLEIRCSACGRTGDYDYEPEAIGTLMRFDGAAARDAKLPQEPPFSCKHCNAKNAYEVSLFSQISAHGALKTLEKDRVKKPRRN